MSCRYAVPQCLYVYGLQDTTASYAIIFLSIIPLTTFILSLLFRMEELPIRSVAGLLKVAGVLLSVGGTMTISLYKGKVLHLWNPVLQFHNEKHVAVDSHLLRGTILLAGSSFTYGCWYLIQSKVLRVYPYKYWSSMATCFIGGFQIALVGVILSRDKSAWKIGWDINLVTIVESGALATGGRFCLCSWVVSKKGPSFAPMFTPLSVVFTVVLGSIFIGDHITVGSLIGTILVIVGTYIFLLAKANVKGHSRTGREVSMALTGPRNESLD